jgi:hypothetical protein
MFFYLYMITVFLEMLLVTGIIPTASSVYPVSKFVYNVPAPSSIFIYNNFIYIFFFFFLLCSGSQLFMLV